MLPIVVWYLSPNGRSPHPDVLPYSVYATLVQCPWHLFFFEMTLAGLDEKLGFISPGTYVNEVYMLRCGLRVCFIPVVLSIPAFFVWTRKRPPAALAMHDGVFLQARFRVGKTISQAGMYG